ncbi:hypothetical protein L218DRAFT_951127 [Marasmius fiardii PR-910]|nr:hypothetical protein L218DRAFT_951127 [Marasmius fiardii PR-910]
MSDVGPPSVAAIYGPLFIGMFLSTILYGTVIYFMRFYKRPGDYPWIQCFASIIEYRAGVQRMLTPRFQVIYLFVADTISTVASFGTLYEPLIMKAGETLGLSVINFNSSPEALIATPVQFFMAWRIKKLSKSKIVSTTSSRIVTAIICSLSLASLAGAIWLGVSVKQKPRFEDFVEFKGAPALWLVTAAVADILIAVTLVYILVRRNSSDISEIRVVKNDKIDRNHRRFIETGTEVTRIKRFFIWDLSLSKLYSNSVLSLLNARGWDDTDQPNFMTSFLAASNSIVSAGTDDIISMTPRATRQLNVQLTHFAKVEEDTRSDSETPGDIELGISPKLSSSHSHTKTCDSAGG